MLLEIFADVIGSVAVEGLPLFYFDVFDFLKLQGLWICMCCL